MTSGTGDENIGADISAHLRENMGHFQLAWEAAEYIESQHQLIQALTAENGRLRERNRRLALTIVKDRLELRARYRLPRRFVRQEDRDV